MSFINTMLFQKVMLALAIGALIGIERERHAKAYIFEKPKKGKRGRKKAVKRKTEIFAGFRTFMLISLLGLLTSHLTSIVINMTPIYIGISSIAVLAFMSYYLNYKKFGVIGMTTEIAFFLTYVIGIFLYFESAPFFLSISLGIILTLILFFREPLHKFAYGLTKKEIRDAIVFAALLFIIFPMLPIYPIGPFGAINLSLIWQSMLVVMFVSFAGYVAMKVFGHKLGIGIAGVFGGLASSTSVAVIMAEDHHRVVHDVLPHDRGRHDIRLQCGYHAHAVFDAFGICGLRAQLHTVREDKKDQDKDKAGLPDSLQADTTVRDTFRCDRVRYSYCPHVCTVCDISGRHPVRIV
jgi:hypothetical protein